ncbi:hypothetical protein HPHPH4_0234 [Helicobacter pylori Hp H-4]|nr:hypothetical protein HPHPH4_0234 [Helicobacter pylori Hp H-4]
MKELAPSNLYSLKKSDLLGLGDLGCRGIISKYPYPLMSFALKQSNQNPIF